MTSTTSEISNHQKRKKGLRPLSHSAFLSISFFVLILVLFTFITLHVTIFASTSLYHTVHVNIGTQYQEVFLLPNGQTFTIQANHYETIQVRQGERFLFTISDFFPDQNQYVHQALESQFTNWYIQSHDTLTKYDTTQIVARDLTLHAGWKPVD